MNTIYLLLKLNQTIYYFFEKMYLNTKFHTPGRNNRPCSHMRTLFRTRREIEDIPKETE